MYLIRLVYASKISEQFKHQDISDILETARTENAKNSVTGLLCFNRKIFLQCLEGSRTKVNQTYRKILNDPRHTDIILLDYKEIIEREFDSWSMGFVPESSLTEPLNLKYSGNTEFNPYQMSGESAQKMMFALKDTIPTQA